jgi:hypothetical protein
MEAFGEDSVRLSLIDTAGIVIASLTLQNSASSALPTVARRTTSSPLAISWDAAHENATVQLLSEVQTPASLLLTNLSAQIIAPPPPPRRKSPSNPTHSHGPPPPRPLLGRAAGRDPRLDPPPDPPLKIPKSLLVFNLPPPKAPPENCLSLPRI